MLVNWEELIRFYFLFDESPLEVEKQMEIHILQIYKSFSGQTEGERDTKRRKTEHSWGLESHDCFCAFSKQGHDCGVLGGDSARRRCRRRGRGGCVVCVCVCVCRRKDWLVLENKEQHRLCCQGQFTRGSVNIPAVNRPQQIHVVTQKILCTYCHPQRWGGRGCHGFSGWEW